MSKMNFTQFSHYGMNFVRMCIVFCSHILVAIPVLLIINNHDAAPPQNTINDSLLPLVKMFIGVVIFTDVWMIGSYLIDKKKGA